MSDKLMSNMDLLKAKREISGSEVMIALCYAKIYSEEHDITDENLVKTFVLTSLFDPEVYPNTKKQAAKNLKKAEAIASKMDDFIKTLAEALGVTL